MDSRRRGLHDGGGVASSAWRYEDVHATGNARQHLGNQYNNTTTNNYTGATPSSQVTVKPPEDPIHADLIRACRQRQGPQRLAFLLGRGANIEHRDQEQWTPLHHAAASGSLHTLSYLVENGADVHASGERVATPLHHAASCGSVEAVKYLIAHGADTNASDEWVGTPLHHAVFSGSAEKVRCLLDGGADINVFCKWVGTPLSIAAARGRLAVIEVLLEHEVDVKQRCGYFGTAAHMACAAGDVDVLQALRRGGAHLDRDADTCYAFYQGILVQPSGSFSSQLGSRIPEGDLVISGHPVILAIYHGHLEAARFCLDSGLDECMYNAYGQSWYTEDKCLEPSSTMRPSINLAIAALDTEMLRLLLNAGVDPDPKPHYFRPPMFDLGVSRTRKATVNGRNASACISLLLRHGARKSCLDLAIVGRETLLMTLMRRDDDDVNYHIIKAVLEQGAPVDATNSMGQTALMIAAGTDHRSRIRCVELLCEHDAAVDLKDRDGRTAWKYAEKWGGSKELLEVKRILRHATGEQLGRSLSPSRQ